jgi:hypothetical protein
VQGGQASAQSTGVAVNLLKLVQNLLYDGGHMVFNRRQLPAPAAGRLAASTGSGSPSTCLRLDGGN